ETVIADKAVLMLEDRIAQTEYAGRIFPVCREEKNRMMVLLLFRDMDDNDLTANIAFLELAFDSWQIPVRIAAGSVEPRMEDIPVSASKAQALLDEGSEVVSRYPGGENEGYRFWYTEGQVVRQLMEGNAPDKAIDYFYSILTRMERMSRSHASCLPMAMTIAVTIVENCLQPPQRELVADELDRLTHAETLADLGACMKELIYAVCSTAYSRKQQETAALLQEIVAFVNKNFMWEQMSLELLSRQFNVSIHFISMSFQTVAGANFSQYLTGLRMNYAKELLRTTEKTLREITADIGYVDESSFSRKFKAMFGVTPGQYRKQAMRERGKE
ncbi:MAG: helix-turn-helix domain-containing protein, partial [Butyricicoccus sp.]